MDLPPSFTQQTVFFSLTPRLQHRYITHLLISSRPYQAKSTIHNFQAPTLPLSPGTPHATNMGGKTLTVAVIACVGMGALAQKLVEKRRMKLTKIQKTFMPRRRR